ncbi:MAG: ribosome-associated translation inhibitor RaiA [Paludibacter sp.]|jgi:putative sigma-54 modulation protein|nr:ribosome-associated translation inhibitor RaiA [Paludibacter sp.]
MKIRIQALNFDATEQLDTYINKKLSKIEKFFDAVQNVDVFLKVVKPESASNKEAEIRILLPTKEIFASKTCDTFEEAIDLSVDAVDKQIRKFKEKAQK